MSSQHVSRAYLIAAPHLLTSFEMAVKVREVMREEGHTVGALFRDPFCNYIEERG